jgi:hypothetical protein
MDAPKLYTEAEVRTKLATDPRWTLRALEVLYQWQTADEQIAGDTRHQNMVGFNSADARRLSFYASLLREGKRLNPRQIAVAQERLPKYAKQILLAIAEKSAGQGANR